MKKKKHLSGVTTWHGEIKVWKHQRSHNMKKRDRRRYPASSGNVIWAHNMSIYVFYRHYVLYVIKVAVMFFFHVDYDKYRRISYRRYFVIPVVCCFKHYFLACILATQSPLSRFPWINTHEHAKRGQIFLKICP